MFKNMKIGGKLNILIAVTVISMSIIGMLSFLLSKSAETTIVTMVDTDIELLFALNGMYAEGLQTGQATRNIFINPSDEKARQNYQKARTSFGEHMTRASRHESVPLQDRLMKIKNLWAEDQALQMEVQRLASEGKAKKAAALLVQKEVVVWRAAKADIRELIEEQKHFFEVKKARELKEIARRRMLLLITLPVTIGIITVLAMFIARKITQPLIQLKSATRDIVNGKFDSPIEVDTNDETADLVRSFDQMRHSLSTYRTQVENNTAELLTEINLRKTIENRLQHDAFHDALTNLPNRALFIDRLEHAIHIAKRHKEYLYAVLFLDLDRFKVVNDGLGHAVGDQLLIEFSKRLATCLRPHDTVARLGGDEFVVLLEDIGGLSNATYIAERIGTALESPFTVRGHDVFTGASIGIALGSPAHENPDQILRDADTAMYQAKSSNQAQFAVFEPGMHAHALERMHLETDLRRAIVRKEFVVFYQPIYSLNANRLAGFEALARWQHPDRGLMFPGAFKQMAEETGMIVAIDRLVLHESCRQMVEWRKECNENSPKFVSVNISNKQMVQPDLVDFVQRVLNDTGLDPSALKLEITESVIIENPEEALNRLSSLKALGVRLYIDDFGTGYSSLSYLHRLPIDGLKIDRSFINNMGANGENQQIVRTIILLAHDMKIDVIAEGLETLIQVAQIKMLNCEYGQGHLFSKPVKSSEARFLFDHAVSRAPVDLQQAADSVAQP